MKGGINMLTIKVFDETGDVAIVTFKGQGIDTPNKNGDWINIGLIRDFIHKAYPHTSGAEYIDE